MLPFDASPSSSSGASTRSADASGPTGSPLSASRSEEDPARINLSIPPDKVRWPVPAKGEIVKRGPVDPTRVVGEMVSARVTPTSSPGAKTVELLPNFEGQFPPVYVEPSSISDVTLFFPESQPGDRILAQMEDGGMIDGSEYVKDGLLDENRLLHFTFTTTDHPGSFKVTIRKDNDQKTMEFWVGPDLPVRQT